MEQGDKGTRCRRRLLLALALLAALPELAAYLAMALTRGERSLGTDLGGWPGRIHALGMQPYDWAARQVLSSTALYPATAALALTCSVAALWPLGRPWRRGVVPALVFLAVGLFPLAYRYQPALMAAPGYPQIVLTPVAFPYSVVREARAAVQARPCDYLLLGWCQGTVFYQEACGHHVRHLAVDPEVGGAPWEVRELPTEWDHRAMPAGQVTQIVRATNVWPATHEPLARYAALDGAALASHDGRWVALVCSYANGPQDVLLVQIAAP